MVKVKKNIKKGFFEVSVPMTSSKVSLYAGSVEELDGKVVKLDLTRSLKGKSLEVKYRLKTEGEIVSGEPFALELAGSFVRRMMRKGSDYVEDSFICDSKDQKVIVKPFLITRNRVSRSVRKMLRDECKKILVSSFKARTAKEIFSEIMANKIQKEMSFKLKKIYPLALCEIRVFKIYSEKESLGASSASAMAANSDSQ